MKEIGESQISQQALESSSKNLVFPLEFVSRRPVPGAPRGNHALEVQTDKVAAMVEWQKEIGDQQLGKRNGHCRLATYGRSSKFKPNRGSSHTLGSCEGLLRFALTDWLLHASLSNQIASVHR